MNIVQDVPNNNKRPCEPTKRHVSDYHLQLKIAGSLTELPAKAPTKWRKVKKKTNELTP